MLVNAFLSSSIFLKMEAPLELRDFFMPLLFSMKQIYKTFLQAEGLLIS
jgi:hypothetical protein